MIQCRGDRPSGRRRRSQKPLPLPIEPSGRVDKRHRREAAIGLDDEIKLSQPRQSVIDVEIGENSDDSRQKLFDPRIEYVTRDGLRFDQQAVIGKQHFLPVLILRLADQVAEDAGIIVDVAVVDVVGDLLLMDQRLAVEISPLPQQESAQRQYSAERGQRVLHVPVLHRAGKAEIEAGDQKQHRQSRRQLDQDRYAAENCRHAQHEMVEQAPHYPYIGKQRLEIGTRNSRKYLNSTAPLRTFCPPRLALGSAFRVSSELMSSGLVATISTTSS